MLLARILLTAVAVTQGVASAAIDLNRTHASNPLWPGHARFHVVWQVGNLLGLMVMETVLIWIGGPHARALFYVALLMTAAPLLGFLMALAGKRRYGGTLQDPNGIPPMRLRLGGRMRQIDGNTLAVYCASVMLMIILVLSIV